MRKALGLILQYLKKKKKLKKYLVPVTENPNPNPPNSQMLVSALRILDKTNVGKTCRGKMIRLLSYPALV